MLKIVKSTSQISDSNAVFLVTGIEDFHNVSHIHFPENFTQTVEKKLKEGKNFSLDFFLGDSHFQKVYVVGYIDNSQSTIDEFLGKEFAKISNKITLFGGMQHDILCLDVCLLSKYETSVYRSDYSTPEVYFVTNSQEAHNQISTRWETIQNIFQARDLVNMAPNTATPDMIADLAKNKIKWTNTKVKILNHADIRKENLNLIDAVGSGSSHKPSLVILERIVDKTKPTYALVGKGVTYDAGGINLKGGQWLPLMKDDMAGAAASLYCMKELDNKDLNVNIVCALPLAENMLGEEAYRTSDIITAYNGKTVEILNTDAEGRLVLADAMSYVSKKYKVDNIITVATLTGACLMALGYNYAGIMGFDQKTVDKIVDISNSSYEKYWQLPFSQYHVEQTKGSISDLKNIADGVYAGSTIGGAFLQNFCDNNEKYVHIDIAGPANREQPYGVFPKGASGFGVDSLSAFFKSL